MEQIPVTSINHLKFACNLTSEPFQIVCVTGKTLFKTIDYDIDSKLFIIRNHEDDSMQILNEDELHKYTLIPHAIKNKCMYYVPEGKEM